MNPARPVPLPQATRSVFRLTLRAMLRTRRSLFLLVLLGLPVLVALVQRLSGGGRSGSFDLYGALVSGYYLGYFAPGVGMALPLVALFYAAALVGDEVEGHTLVYFLTRPIPRAALVFGKFSAYLAWTLTATLVSLGLVFLLARAPNAASPWVAATTFARDLGVSFIALASYGAVFALAGVLLRRPLLPGLLFLYVWEFGARLAGPFARLTLGTYVEPLLARRTMPLGQAWLSSPTAVSTMQAALVVGLVALLSLVAASAVFARREYVANQ
jgi:ABC-type transport system involved in multi-copper enzyme maturation permease subunit